MHAHGLNGGLTVRLTSGIDGKGVSTGPAVILLRGFGARGWLIDMARIATDR